MNRARSAIDRMAAQAVPTAQQLHCADPAPERELARILHQPRPRIAQVRTVPRRPWRPLLVVAVVLAVLGTLVVLLPTLSGGGGPAPVATTPEPTTTPPLPADDEPLTYDPTGVDTDPAALLRGLADRAAAQPPPAGSGPVNYVRTRGGQFDDNGLSDAYERETWAAPDGSGHSLLTHAGAAPQIIGERGPTSNSLPPIGPADPVELERAIRATYRLPDGVSTLPPSVWFTELTRRWNFLVVDPQVQATYLRLLAAQDGFTVAGTVIDRAGRRGVAVTAEVDPAFDLGEATLILDPDTGALLGVENGPPGFAPGTPPPPKTWTVWLESAHVPAIGDRP